jgi:CheY-like chemotaxis protein
MKDALPTLVEDIKILLFESVRELLFNVVKHAQVTVATVELRLIRSQTVEITVWDTGRGFDPNQVKLARAAGSGFGLFSIRERLDLIGGKLQITSAPGQGSRFVLTAPVNQAVVAALPNGSQDTERQIQPTPLTRSLKTSGTIRVMLADDHAVMREGLARLLGEQGDLEIVGQATQGLEAVQLAAQLQPDVILMDISMPRMNGIEATRIIHQDFPEIRIIGLSMFEEPEQAQAMREAGAVNYLTKSGPSADLLRAIREG